LLISYDNAIWCRVEYGFVGGDFIHLIVDCNSAFCSNLY
jgi:hypothetical protein